LIQIKKPAPAMRLMAFMNAKKQRRRKSSSSRHPAEVEDADRKIKDYLLRLHLSLWHPISTAPANHDLESKVLDRASSIILPFPCRRTTAGEWINADLETSIDIRPTKWRPWQKAKARKLLLNTGSDLPHQNEQRWSDT
jgi:hypothetical protein